MRSISRFKAGIALGLVMGLWHFGWAALVAVGWAQPFIDFIVRLHFIAPFMKVQPFEAGTAGLLVGVTSGLGFLSGFVLAAVWNWLHPQRPRARA